MFSDLYLYLDFNWEQYINHPDTYFKDMNALIRLAYMHKANVLYSKNQLAEFSKNCGDIDENFLKSTGNKIAILLENAKPVNDSSPFYFTVHFNSQGSYILHEKLGILQLVEVTGGRSIITLGDQSGPLTLLKINPNGSFENIQMVVANTQSILIDWLSELGPDRNFSLSVKHGENGMGGWAGESKLLCNRQAAQTLLNNAIGDFNRINRLFNFDEHHNTYIEFFYEGNNPQNGWHAFHVEEHHVHGRVPNEVRKHFNQ